MSKRVVWVLVLAVMLSGCAASSPYFIRNETVNGQDAVDICKVVDEKNITCWRVYP